MKWQRDEHAKKIDKLLELAYLDDHNFRDTVISKDEITDLVILLNTEEDFNKILEQL